MSSEPNEDIIKTPQEVKYFIIESNEKYKLHGKDKSDDPDIDEDTKHQIIKFFIVRLNEEYKSYQKNMRFRQNLYVAEIFISLISIFLGQLFALAEDSDIMAKIGTQISSIFGAIGVLVTVVTAYLNNTAQKYLETGSSTELDENTFKPMYLHINDKVIKNFGNSFKGKSEPSDKLTLLDFYVIKLMRRNDILLRERIFDMTVSVFFFFFILGISIFLSLLFQVPNQTYITRDEERILRLSLMYLGGIWIVLIILSKSFDFIETLEFRVYAKKDDNLPEGLIKYERDLMEELTDDPKTIPKRKLHRVRLKLYPQWVANIELILNGIGPIIDEKDYNKFSNRTISRQVYTANKNFKKSE
ncbi:20019_t:CDS:2 [Cetraspora pellucida]|uniref:20019_t:CDS:1 n=1 Tax=Cetraspora pellucida TaxID=1433469 RepID=A0A9N9EEL8_9GLOM|nr:20019_t:CDS:2 [Cetraspora pellucida]